MPNNKDRITKYDISRKAGVPADFARKLRDLTWPQWVNELDAYYQHWPKTPDFKCPHCKRKTKPHRYKNTTFYAHIIFFHKSSFIKSKLFRLLQHAQET